jgi:glycosyltransferase involved in cell wall biosynthesis
MNILLLNDEFYTTGASIALYWLALHLKDAGHTVSVMPRVNGGGAIRQQYDEAKIPIVTDANGIDAVLANGIMQGEIVAAVGQTVPVVWWIHEAEIGRNLVVHQPSLAQGFRHARHVVFQTEFQRVVYGSYLFDAPADVSVVPIWNDTVYRERPRPAGKPADRTRLVSIGTVEPRKRFADIMLAVEALPDHERAAIECVFIGKSLTVDEQITALARQFPERYRFVGELPAAQALGYLASADVFVLASDSESQPLTLFEAFELQVPVCVSALPSYRHIGIAHGVHALTHPVGNIAMLAANIGIAIRDRTVRNALTSEAKRLIDARRRNDWKSELERIIVPRVGQPATDPLPAA